MMLSVSAIKFEEGCQERAFSIAPASRTVQNARAGPREVRDCDSRRACVSAGPHRACALALAAKPGARPVPVGVPSRSMELALAANSGARPFASKRPRRAWHALQLWGLGSLTFSGSDCVSGNLSADSLAPPFSRAAIAWAPAVPRAATDICGRPHTTTTSRSSGG